jgi:hypothetical protein
MSQLYDETLVFIGYDIKGEKKKVKPKELEKYKRLRNLNPRYYEEINTIEKAKSRIFSSINFQYNIFSGY